MTDQEKLDINKQLRAYKGDNEFLLSLKRGLNGKYCERIKVGKRSYKILSDRQYEAALRTLS